MPTREALAELYRSPLAEARYQKIEADLRKFAEEKLKFDFDPIGTHLFSLMELRQSYARRCTDFVDSIHRLLEAGRIVPAAILGRSLIETVAMGSLFLTDMVDCVRAGNKERLELRLTRFYAGVAGQEPKPVHVMDAIRHLQKLDAAYVAYLDAKYGFFTALDKVRAEAAGVATVESHDELLSMMRVYDELSEIAHPNGTGVQYLYPDPSNEDAGVGKVRDHYKRLALSSVWQCKHLLKALEETRDIPEKYRVKIGLPSEEPQAPNKR